MCRCRDRYLARSGDIYLDRQIERHRAGKRSGDNGYMKGPSHSYIHACRSTVKYEHTQGHRTTGA
jgi:hypothetical protein